MAEENPAAPSSLTDKLATLASLRASGALTDEQFERAKEIELGSSALPAKREAPPADTPPPKKKATPPPATPEAATPQAAQPASIDLTNDTEAAPPPPPPAAPPPPPPAAPPHGRSAASRQG